MSERPSPLWSDIVRRRNSLSREAAASIQAAEVAFLHTLNAIAAADELTNGGAANGGGGGGGGGSSGGVGGSNGSVLPGSPRVASSLSDHDGVDNDNYTAVDQGRSRTRALARRRSIAPSSPLPSAVHPSLRGRAATVWGLPDHLTLLVFSYCSCSELAALMQVCAAWRVLANDVILWSEVTVKPRKTFNNNDLLQLVTLHPSISKLNINDRVHIGDLGIAAVSHHCFQLDELRMRCCSKVTDAGMVFIAWNCGPTLTGLYADNCDKLTDDFLKQLGLHAPNLKVLELAGCLQITDYGLQFVSGKFQNLVSLGLSRCESISATGLQAILPFTPNLKRLYLRDCKLVNDEAASIIARCCPSLEILNVGVTQVADRGLLELCRECRSLQRLYLRDLRVTHEGLVDITNLTELEILFLNGCVSLTDKALEYIGHLSELVELSIENVPTITPEGLAHVRPERCPNIQRLFLTRTKVNDQCLAVFSQLQSKLTILGLNGCESVTIEGIRVIVENCPELKTLWLVQCPNVNKEDAKVLCDTLKGCELKTS